MSGEDMRGDRGASPFYHRAPIVDPSHFYGRQREIDAILARTVGAAKPQCVSVIGGRRIGKSSLFRQLVDVRGPELLKGADPVVFAYDSLEGSSRLSVERFFQGLLKKVERPLRRGHGEGSGPRAQETAEETFTNWVEELSDEGFRVVLFLDEFDVVTMNRHFDVDFFGRLRYLANSFSLAYVTSSIAELADLCHHDEIRQSPFFNVFSTLHLGLLAPAEARELLMTESGLAGAQFSDADVGFLTDLAGTHPFHLQQAANALWEAPQPPDLAAVRETFVEDAAPHFRYSLAQLSAARLRLLRAAAAGERPAGPDAADVSFLTRRGLLVRAGDGFAPFSAAFGAWLLEQPLATPATIFSTPDAHRPDDSLADTQAAPPPPGPGTVLEGRHELLREIGRGGFGVVYEADDRVLHRRVAIKFLRPDRARDDANRRHRDRFLQEAQAASRINHPNVVTIHDIREHGGALFFVMEHFVGRSVRELLEDVGALPPQRALPLVIQAATGLQAAHSLGIVHRDVKPENLLVDEAGRLKIVDFGLAYLAEQQRLTSESAVVMTPRYCSPEQILNEALDARSDIFSLGCVLYEALTGNVAFDGSSVSAVFYRILNQTPPEFLDDASHLPPRVASLIRRCLARERSDRPATCAEVARELNALLEA